jgi:hypothetical protein
VIVNRPSSTYLIWVNAIRDVGFPAVVAMVLLYALLVKFPETFRQINMDSTDKVLQTVLQNRADIIRDQQLTVDFQNLAIEAHKRTQAMLDEVLRELRKK